MLPTRIETAPTRFASKIDKRPDGCWYWTGHLGANGYGHLAVGHRMLLAHRYAYEHLVGPIPDGLTIDHLCRVRQCVNPEHLEAVTIQVNIERAGKSARASCANGHPFDDANTYVWTDGARRCRECVRLSTARYRARLRAVAIEGGS